MPLVSRNFNIGVVGANMESAHYQKYLQHMRHNTDATVRLAETHEVRRRRTLAPPHPRQAAPSPLREVACALPSRPDTRGRLRETRPAAKLSTRRRRVGFICAFAFSTREARCWQNFGCR